MSDFSPDLEKTSPKSRNRRKETAEAKLVKERVSGHVRFAEKEKPSPPSVNAPLEYSLLQVQVLLRALSSRPGKGMAMSHGTVPPGDKAACTKASQHAIASPLIAVPAGCQAKQHAQAEQ